MEEKTAIKLVDNILDELNDRGGFDGWWGSIDTDTQDEIKLELVGIVLCVGE